jgi:hypothetical protein
MALTRRTDLADIPGDLDRFLGNFFSPKGWRSEISYDPAENRLYLDVRLAAARLSADDRFLSLVEYFSRGQDALLRRRSGTRLHCRLYAADGSELTTELHRRGARYLDDREQGPGMRRRLAWLGFRRRFVARILPGAALWTATFVFVTQVMGMTLDTALLIAVGAVGLQYVLIVLTRRP